MLLPFFVAYLVATSMPLIDAKKFWWSYQGVNNTESYDPVFDICANSNATSCASCNSADDGVGAVLCESLDKLNNICYEPKLEETCCKDKFGTSCSKDFYCAYTEANVAFCCHDGEDVGDCGKNLNQTLSEDMNSDKDTASATSAFQPSMTASDQSRVPRPDRTTPPHVVPGSSKTYNNDPDVDKKMSAAVKIGIAIGVFAGAAILLTLAMLGVLYLRKRKTKYNAVEGQADDKLIIQHPEPVGRHPSPDAIGPFEDMRNDARDHRQSWMASPPHSGPPTPNRFSDGPAYSDHPLHPQNPVELQHLPPPGHH